MGVVCVHACVRAHSHVYELAQTAHVCSRAGRLQPTPVAGATRPPGWRTDPPCPPVMDRHGPTHSQPHPALLHCGQAIPHHPHSTPSLTYPPPLRAPRAQVVDSGLNYLIVRTAATDKVPDEYGAEANPVVAGLGSLPAGLSVSRSQVRRAGEGGRQRGGFSGGPGTARVRLWARGCCLCGWLLWLGGPGRAAGEGTALAPWGAPPCGGHAASHSDAALSTGPQLTK